MKRRERADDVGHRRLTQTPYNFFGALLAGFAVVAFCLILLWHDPLLFWNDDYELSILPVFADIARSWSEGNLPLLSPYSWVCGNLAGEFQYGTFSVFVNAAVVLIWKFPLTFPQQAAALSIVHLFVLALGGYLLARGRNLTTPLSLVVALVAALNGWIICWGATDWFGALGAFAWLPWAWWGMERALDPQRSRWRFLWPAPFVYFVVTGGFPYTVLMAVLLGAWLICRSLVETKKLSSVWPLALGIVLGFGLAAPAWLALFDYVYGSARAAQDSAEHFQWRVPVAALPALILPSWTVNWADFSSRLMPHTATELTCGLVPPVALLAGLAAFGRGFARTIKWELALLVLVLLLCMLPTANLFRWSFRWLPLLHLVLALCAAESLRWFAGSASTVAKRPGVIGFVLTLLVIGVASFTGANGPRAHPFIWVALGTSAVWALSEVSFSAPVRKWVPAMITFAAFLTTYLCIPPNCGVPKYNLAQELAQPAPLDSQRLYLSIYPPPEHAYRVEKHLEPFGTTVRPGSASMWAGVHFINGYSPIRPAGVAREFDAAIHGEIPLPKATSLLQREAGHDGLLARLGIDGIVVASEIDLVPEPATEWQMAAATTEGRIFQRRKSLPRIQSLHSIDSRPNEQFADAIISELSERRNSISAAVTLATADRPALLAVSRPFFDGYRATVGGRAVPVTSYRGLIPIIEVPAGMNGQLILSYRPPWLVLGTGLSLFCAALFTIGSVLAFREKKPT